MIEMEIMQDASEIVRYDSPHLPCAIQARLLSEYTDMRALCHWHPDLECIHIFEGEMYYDINGEQILLQAEDSLFVNSQQLHFGYANQEKECRFAVILFHPQILKSNLYNYQKNVYPLTHASGIHYWLFPSGHPQAEPLTQILQAIFGLRDDASGSNNCLLIGLFHCLWHIIRQNSSQYLDGRQELEDPDISLQKQMVSYIYDHYMENIDLNTIAASAHISRSKCCKIFQRYLQQSPIAFLNSYRMDISRSLLQNTSYSITDIAVSCGYNHPSYFSKMFSRRFGCTPYQCRKENLSADR